MIEPSKCSAENENPSQENNSLFARQSRHAAWIMLVVCLVIVATATMDMTSIVERTAESAFIFRSDEIRDVIANRIDDHARILLSGAALFNASDMVTREKWHIFTQTLKVEKQLPGIQGFGFSLLIPRAELTRHIQEIRSEGFPDYNVWPSDDREIYSSIIYLEPFSNRNLWAFGYDMFSEPVRREVMERARDTNSAALSGKVVLVQESNEEIQAGTLMFVPVYRKGMPTDSVEQRRAAIYGWVGSPYRMNDLIQGILGGRNLEQEHQLHLQIFDDVQCTSQSLLYESPPVRDKKLQHKERFIREIPVDFNGHRWTLRFTQSYGGFFTAEFTKAWLVMVTGTLIALLLYTLIRVMLNTGIEARRLAQMLTVDLRESEEKFRVLIENSFDIIFTINSEGILIFTSPAWERHFGCPVSDVTGISFVQFVHPEDVAPCAKYLKRVLSTGKRETSPAFRVKHANDKWYWCVANGTAYVSPKGEHLYIGVGHDIGSALMRKKAEEVLLESERRLSFLLNSTPAVIYTCHASGDFGATFVSDNVQSQLGYPASEFIKNPAFWSNHIHPEDKERIFAELSHLFEQGRHEHEHEYRFRLPDGTYRWMQDQVKLLRDATGQPTQMIGYWTDITKRKQAEEALRNHQAKIEMQNEELHRVQAERDAAGARYFDFYDQAPAGYLTLSKEELILTANLTMATFLDIARSDLVNQPLGKYIFKEDHDIYLPVRESPLRTQAGFLMRFSRRWPVRRLVAPGWDLLSAKGL